MSEKLSQQELEELARDTRDPFTLPLDIYEQMKAAKVGPFAHDWLSTLACVF